MERSQDCTRAPLMGKTLSEEGAQAIAMKLLQDLRKLLHFQATMPAPSQEFKCLLTCQHHPGFRFLSSLLTLLPRASPGSD